MAERRTSPDRDEGDLEGLFDALEDRIEDEGAGRWGALQERFARWPAWGRRTTVAALTLAVPMLSLFKTRHDGAQAPYLQILAVGLFCVVLAMPLVLRALRSWYEPTPSTSATAAWVVGTLGGLTALLALPLGHAHLPVQRVPEGTAALGPLLGCLTYGALFALPVYLVARWLGRATPHSRLYAAAAAGLSGNLALLAHCPITGPAHLVPAHAGVLALAVALAWVMGSRASSP